MVFVRVGRLNMYRLDGALIVHPCPHLHTGQRPALQKMQQRARRRASICAVGADVYEFLSFAPWAFRYDLYHVLNRNEGNLMRLLCETGSTLRESTGCSNMRDYDWFTGQDKDVRLSRLTIKESIVVENVQKNLRPTRWKIDACFSLTISREMIGGNV